LQFKASPGKSSKRPYLKKKAGKVAKGGGPEFKPQYQKKEKKKKRTRKSGSGEWEKVNY
jgi:hypothetical protein